MGRLPRIVGRKWRAVKIIFNRGAVPLEAQARRVGRQAMRDPSAAARVVIEDAASTNGADEVTE